MRTRLTSARLTRGRLTGARLTRSRLTGAVAALLALATLQACSGLDDVLSPGQKAANHTPAHVGLSARLPSFAKGTATALSLRVLASYLREDGSKIALATLNVSLDDAPTQQVPLAIDLAPCLADPQRKGAGKDAGCVVALDVVLLDGTRVIDQQTIGPLPLNAGEQRTLPDAVQLFEVASVKVSTGTVGAGNPGTDPTRLVIGAKLALEATVSSTTGQTAERALQWTSDAPTIATVDAATGVVTGVAPGRVHITASVVGVDAANGAVDLTVVPATSPITVTAAGTGAGRVTSSPSGLDCAMAGGQSFGACSAPFAGTTQVTLTATPDPDATFDGWGGACAGASVGAQCVLDAAQARTATATFTSSRRRVAISASGTGVGTVTGTGGIACRAAVGAVAGACEATLAVGAAVTLTATPSAGQTFGGWSGACAAAGTSPTCTLSLGSDAFVSARFDGTTTALSVDVSGAGGGRVSIAGGVTGVCAHAAGGAPDRCMISVPNGATVTLSAAADPGSAFTGWSGACAGTGPCTVTVAQAATVGASFARRQVTLTVSLGGAGIGAIDAGGTTCALAAGQITATCRLLVDQDVPVVLRATAGAGSAVGAWVGACQGTSGTVCTLTPTADVVAGALFQPLRVALNVAPAAGASGDGSVVDSTDAVSCAMQRGTAGPGCATTLPFGRAVTLRAVPAINSTFGGWGGACASVTTATCALESDAALAVVAQFTIIRNTLSVSVGGTGAGTVTSNVGAIACPSNGCATTQDYGTVVTLTATPSSGSAFGGWSGACTGAATTCTVTLDAARTVTASFARILVPLTVTLGGTGAGAVTSVPNGIYCPGTCSTAIPLGTQVTLTATATTGNLFDGWTGACAGAGTTCTLSMDAAKTVTASFALGTVPFTAAVSGSGTGVVRSTPPAIDCPLTTCTAQLPIGAAIVLTATPATGSTFTRWDGCPDAATQPGKCVVPTSSAQRVTAMFSLAGGTTSGSVPNGGSNGGSNGGTSGGTSGGTAGASPASPTSPSAGVMVTLAGTGAGTVVGRVGGVATGIACPGTCTATYGAGTRVALIATSSATSVFVGWSGACTGAGECAFVVAATDAPRAITATFAAR